MSRKTLNLTESLYDYVLSVSSREPQILQQLREKTASLERAEMQISPEQGQFMAWLIQLMGAAKTLEIGVFTGYSALSVALALPEDGKIIACDVNEEWTAIGQKYWEKAGIADKIDLHLAPALTTLDHLIASGESGSFDFAFIDADKTNYLHYYERTLQLIRPGGVIMVDNVLWGGSVINPDKQDDDTIAIRQFNEHLHQDDRITLSLLPIADGLTLAIRR